jgi:hypothetical protein
MIYDTKYVFTSLFSPKLPNKGPEFTSLEKIEESIKNNKEIFDNKFTVEMAQGYHKYSDSNKDKFLHESGYDAYLTGWIYIKMMD